MIRGRKANEAAERLIESLRQQRSQHPSGMHRGYFAFPQIKMVGEADWCSASIIVVSSIGAVISPKDPPAVKVKDLSKHPIPSYIVTIPGVEDFEYHVSKHNMEELLKVQCIVITPYKREQANVRIPEEIVTRIRIDRIRKIGRL